MTPLHYAAAAGDVGVCSVLLQQYQSVLLHAIDNLGKTALHHALYWKRVQVAILLIQQGAQLTNVKDTYGNTPSTLIDHLTVIARHLRQSRQLIKHVRETAVASRFLSVSARLGYADVVRELLDSRAPLCDCQDFMGRTALHEAVQAEVDTAKIVGLLLSQPQLDPNIQDQRGETALHYACRAGRVGVVAILLSDERIQPFMQVGDKLVKSVKPYLKHTN